MGIALTCVLFCVRGIAKKVPHNYLLTAAFTFCEAYVVAFCVASVNDPMIVVTAAFMTAGIVVGLTIYAMTTKTDFTFCGGTLFVVGAAFIMFGLFSFMFGSTFRLVYCTLGVILFGIYLIVDT
jgi:FtsH-binding integral membrane protein